MRALDIAVCVCAGAFDVNLFVFVSFSRIGVVHEYFTVVSGAGATSRRGVQVVSPREHLFG